MTEQASPVRILVVDDESTPRMAITEALNLLGYQAVEAASGREALSRLAAGRYDLMLLDLRMPGMDGVEVMRRVSLDYPDLLIIILTAFGSIDSAIEAVRAGAADYLLKPSSIRDTEAAIARALARRWPGRRKKGPAEGIEADEAPSVGILRRTPLTLDLETNVANLSAVGWGQARTAQLTESEAALLACLMRRPNKVFSCRELAREALKYDVSEREARELVRPHFSRLRQKLEQDPSQPSLIRTIRGKGYLLFLP